jgi:hypothetical protein
MMCGFLSVFVLYLCTYGLVRYSIGAGTGLGQLYSYAQSVTDYS